jgi:hypothetical protein
MMYYERPIQVYCKECQEWYNEKDTTFVNIEEDIQGRDKLTFVCPEGHETSSLRRG